MRISAKTRVNLDGFDIAFDQIRKVIDKNCEEVANLVLNEAKTTAAFIDRSGTLRRSIKMYKASALGNGYIIEARGKKGDGSWYQAASIEYGHVKMLWGHPTGERVSARPFMRPAAEKGIRRAVEIFR